MFTLCIYDGENRTFAGFEDLLELVGDRCGIEVSRFIEDYVDDLEREVAELNDEVSDMVDEINDLRMELN